MNAGKLKLKAPKFSAPKFSAIKPSAIKLAAASVLFITLSLPSALLIQGCGQGDAEGKIEASGTIEATEVTLNSRSTGEILSMNATEGMNVKPGDTLLIIDHELLDIQLRQAEAGRDLSQAQYQLLLSGARSEDINQAEEALRQAEINLRQAQSDKERMERLYSSAAITKKQYEDALSRYQITQAQSAAASENVRKLKNFARPEELKQARANLTRSDASAELLRKNIRDSYVTSPVNGTVVKKYVEAGETVMPSTALFKIADLSKVNLLIYVSEEELGRIKPGQRADVSVDSYPGRIFEGKVVFISPEAEFTPKNIQTKDERTKLVFAVKVEIQNPGFSLKAGMPADAVILTNTSK